MLDVKGIQNFFFGIWDLIFGIFFFVFSSLGFYYWGFEFFFNPDTKSDTKYIKNGHSFFVLYSGDYSFARCFI
jgi:hypothetical protein